MARYIDVGTALTIIDKYAKTVSEDEKIVVDAIRDIVEIITPAADVAPKHTLENSQRLLKAAWDRIEELDELCGKLTKAKSEPVMKGKNIEIPQVKSLRWLAFNFPKIENPADDCDRLTNCINLYCTNAANLMTS